MKKRADTRIHRKVYKAHYGEIPREDNGRRYEIHHIDNNHRNNDPANLVAVPIQEHYDIHYAQGDWAACLLIASHMKISHEDKVSLARLDQQKRVAEGTHNFLGGAVQRERVANGTHNFAGSTEQKERAIRRVSEGTHNFLTPYTCPHCNKEGAGPMMKRWHFDNCKHR